MTALQLAQIAQLYGPKYQLESSSDFALARAISDNFLGLEGKAVVSVTLTGDVAVGPVTICKVPRTGLYLVCGHIESYQPTAMVGGTLGTEVGYTSEGGANRVPFVGGPSVPLPTPTVANFAEAVSAVIDTDFTYTYSTSASFGGTSVKVIMRWTISWIG